MSASKYYQWQDELLKKRKTDRRALLFLARYYRAIDPDKTRLTQGCKELESLLGNALLQEHPWWKPLILHWLFQLMVCHIGHVKSSLSRCMETLAELEDPVYKDFPQRHCIINDLINIYTDMDIVGYFPEIKRIIKDELDIIPKDMHCYICFMTSRLDLYRFEGDLVDAKELYNELHLLYREWGKDTFFLPRIQLGEVYCDRGYPKKAAEVLNTIEEEKLEFHNWRIKYLLTKGKLLIKYGDSILPDSLPAMSKTVIDIGKNLDSDLYQWRGHRLQGDYHYRRKEFARACACYRETLMLMEDHGAYRDEAKTALCASVAAAKCNDRSFDFFLQWFEQANGNLKKKRYDKEITQLKMVKAAHR